MPWRQMAAIQHIVTRAEFYSEHRSPPHTALRTLRVLKGLSASRLAALADVDRSTIARLEQGIGQPQRRTAHKIAAVLGCPVEILFPENDAAPAGGPTLVTTTPMDGGRDGESR
jgi:putative transcriptional regulator